MSKVASEWRSAVFKVKSLELLVSDRKFTTETLHSIFYSPLLSNVVLLSLENCGLTDSDIKMLCESCNDGNFRNLKDLLIGSNPISINSVIAIHNSELVNILKQLYFEDTLITVDGMKEFIHQAESHKKVVWLYSIGYFLSMEGNNEESLEYYKMAAELGDVDSFYELGVAYSMQDIEQSKYWHEKAVKQGHQNATASLAEIYLKKGDYKQAFEFFSQAGEKGCAYSMKNIAFMYENGQYVEQDYSKSKKWLLKSTAFGDIALHELGMRYLNGSFGFEKNLQKAIRYFQSQYHPSESSYQLALMYLEGNEYIQKDALKAIEILEKAYDTNAALLLGSIYAKGVEGVVPKDIKKAIEAYYRAYNNPEGALQIGILYLEKFKTEESYFHYMAKGKFEEAANAGSVEAMFRLAELLKTTFKDLDESDRNYSMAASNNHVIAQYQLALYHKEGIRNFEKNPEKAKYYFEQAANQGHSGAQYELAVILSPENYEQSLKLLNLSIEQGNSFAMDMLAKWYLKGTGVGKDEKRAVELLEKSCEIGGCSNSYYELSLLYEAGLGCEVNKERAAELKGKAIELGEARSLIDQFFFFEDA
ncbi:SEL1 repeat domain-containing protein [Naegleria gruberi]|uniref:SEL1 repeat domain-containing protein n=1 Tax=Naegleria gruberi TaxID=5762 RepID=D2V7N6_NAEGR|nr:SEL1 repeat domain-containing protein [Naegleria gruberi]EFC46904.1 SEL1 repeat domain-containing protein [Naegleria gruberi]|eukprot:XP_002679648.1 SEL1 repeat domain-containing protein [Naegleria gruberi strain NEG-M]